MEWSQGHKTKSMLKNSKVAIATPKDRIFLKKYEGNPILKPNPDNEWENLAVCNPGVWYENGKCTMLYRAAGKDEEHYIRNGAGGEQR